MKVQLTKDEHGLINGYTLMAMDEEEEVILTEIKNMHYYLDVGYFSKQVNKNGDVDKLIFKLKEKVSDDIAI
jgi:hypothetical protein